MAGLNHRSTNMSLRTTNPSRIVQTDIIAGPWPSGPTNPNHEPPYLDDVDWAADKTTLFGRRAARPGLPFLNRPRQTAFLPPIFIPNSPLDENTTLAISPGKSHSTTRRANPGDSPVPPPSAVLRCLPDFGHCFSHLCGHPARASRHLLLRGADDVAPGGADKFGSYCDMCPPGTLGLCRAMHELPCGHMICSAHLAAAAENAVDTAKSQVPQIRENLRDAAGELAWLRRDLVPAETAPRLRASQEARMAYWRRLLVGMLGLGCGVCGADMFVVEEDFILCLDEWLARQLWVVTWALLGGGGVGEGRAVRCGWGDCGAAIPAWCGYTGETGESFFYCVACEGNSQWLDSVGLRPTM